MVRRLISTLFLAGLVMSPAILADPLLEDRVARLERIQESEGGSNLQLQIQQLQQEIQDLRGIVEQLQFSMQFPGGRQGARFGGYSPDYRDPPPLLPPGADLSEVREAAPATNAGPAEGAGTAGRGDLLGPMKPAYAPPPTSTGRMAIPSLPSPETPGGNERDAYRSAFDLLKDRKYDEAAEAFREMLARYPEGQFADNGRYWLAETDFVRRDFPAALVEYDRLVTGYPQSPKVPGALLKIGYIHFEQEDWPQARTALEEVMRRYPTSTEARLAKSRLDRMSSEGH